MKKYILLMMFVILASLMLFTGCQKSSESVGEVTISIIGYDDNIIADKEVVTIEENDTVLDITEKIIAKKEVSFEQKSGFIVSIDGQKQFDKGPESGWRYALNNQFPSLGAGSVSVKDGDEIIWIFALTIDDDGGITTEDAEQEVKEKLNGEVQLESAVNETTKTIEGLFERENGLRPFRVVLAHNLLGLEKEENFEIIQEESSLNYAINILTILAADLDPYSYNETNYVKLLADSQKENGKFVIIDWDDYPSTQAYAMAALELAGYEDYNKSSAENALIGMINEDGSVGSYMDVDTAAMALLGFMDKESEQANEAVNKILSFIKSKQLETGGFPGFDGSENIYTLSAVINGLMAVDINPNGQEFVKGENTISSALMSFYKDGRFEHEDPSGVTEVEWATEQAYLALAELYKGESSFRILKQEK